jgi:uncharacterized protein (TIGR03089 family)
MPVSLSDMPNRTLADVLLTAMQREPARPRMTYCDDEAGVRVELSGATLANWAAKTANLMRDEFGLLPGARVAVLAPAHWQTAVALLGVWWAGAEVVLHPDAGAELALAAVDRIGEADGIAEVAALSLDPMGGSARGLPAGVADYTTAARVHGDRFQPNGAGPALAGMAVADVLDRSGRTAETLTDADRVLSTRAWYTPDDVIDGLIAVLAAGASLVQVANPDPEAQERRVEAERITKRLD